ncbi:MAG: T9SS type A sorting domain-containing protein, partial [Chitinophagaceae bacterium]|nr:T9SS type A sorting domain-containing protein [Chitinophagaceae bacterium]
LKSDRKGDLLVGNIYPNPVNSILNLSIESTKNTKVEIVLVNTLGMKVYQQPASIATGNNLQSINISRLAAGLYHVQIVTPTGEVIQAGKVTKQ